MQYSAPSFEEAVLTLAEMAGWNVHVEYFDGVSYTLIRKIESEATGMCADDVRFCTSLDAVIKVLEQQ